jgi:hypothetical protein
MNAPRGSDIMSVREGRNEELRKTITALGEVVEEHEEKIRREQMLN